MNRGSCEHAGLTLEDERVAPQGGWLPNLGVPEPQEAELRWMQLADTARDIIIAKRLRRHQRAETRSSSELEQRAVARKLAPFFSTGEIELAL